MGAESSRLRLTAHIDGTKELWEWDEARQIMRCGEVTQRERKKDNGALAQTRGL